MWCLGGKRSEKRKEKVIKKEFSKVWWHTQTPQLHKQNLLNIRWMIKKFNYNHSHKQYNKLSRFQDESKWKHFGRSEIVQNKTNVQFSTTEMEAQN